MEMLKEEEASWARERESVCVCGKDLNFQKSVHYLFEKKTLERRWCFFFEKKLI